MRLPFVCSSFAEIISWITPTAHRRGQYTSIDGSFDAQWLASELPASQEMHSALHTLGERNTPVDVPVQRIGHAPVDRAGAALPGFNAATAAHQRPAIGRQVLLHIRCNAGGGSGAANVIAPLPTGGVIRHRARERWQWHRPVGSRERALIGTPRKIGATVGRGDALARWRDHRRRELI